MLLETETILILQFSTNETPKKPELFSWVFGKRIIELMDAQKKFCQ